MKLRLKCKCGAEFEARSFFTGLEVSEVFQWWAGVHNLCYGIAGMRQNDEGRLVFTPVSEAQKDRAA